jgi:hypothetical protein
MEKSKIVVDALTPLSILIFFQFDEPMIGHHDHVMEYRPKCYLNLHQL